MRSNPPLIPLLAADALGAYQATALSVRDNLIVGHLLMRAYNIFIFLKVNWNATQLNYTRKAPKRAYYLSLEFLMGRTLDNTVSGDRDFFTALFHSTAEHYSCLI